MFKTPTRFRQDTNKTRTKHRQDKDENKDKPRTRTRTRQDSIETRFREPHRNKYVRSHQGTSLTFNLNLNLML